MSFIPNRFGQHTTFHCSIILNHQYDSKLEKVYFGHIPVAKILYALWKKKL